MILALVTLLAVAWLLTLSRELAAAGALVLSLIGLILAARARKRIHRSCGVIQGEGIARAAKYIHGTILSLSILYMLWTGLTLLRVGI